METKLEPFDFRLSEYGKATEYVQPPQPYLAQKVADLRYERVEEGVVYLYRHDDIIKINRHPKVLGVGGRGPAFGVPMPLIPLEIDGDDHAKWRRILDPMFTPKQVARLEDAVRRLAGELVDGFAGDDIVDITQRYCVPLPCLTFLQLFGAPTKDLDFFLQFMKDILHPTGKTAEENQEIGAAAGMRLVTYFTEHLANRRATEPRDDVLGILLETEIDGERLNDMELMNIITLMMFAGLDTVTSSLSLMLDWLARHPDERARVIADTSLIRGLVEELLRYESPVPVGTRYPTEDVDLGDGLVIKAGEAILASWATANLDASVHDDPLRINIDRPRHQHIAFASGTHRCLGSNLARMELKIAIEELHKRLPHYELAPGEDVRYVNLPVRSAEYLPLKFLNG
ncbi:cytochrome P450 [Mycobacterium seoulense]|uniref:cytochrome P450 n=1 Tax=Mycobacterium seoulense TaxID=386911 RepID=UPI003CEFF4AF